MAEYIDREAAVDAVTGIYYDTPEINLTSEKFEAAINGMPAADVAPVRHGRWEKWNGDDRHHCTVCECYANAERDSYGYIAYEFLDNYCPNCRAYMLGEEVGNANMESEE